MTITPPQSDVRPLKTVALSTDLAVIGGGLAGACAAITAARAGARVVLVQDRPVLGGNASSEVRLWVLGATSHMGNNNRWAREGGVVDEILVENTYRNPEGNPLIFDTVLLEKVTREPNITLLLNTAVYELTKRDADTIASVRAFCSQNSTLYDVTAPLFCDASGDGVVGFLAGAAFRMGAESRDEFGEKFAPTKEYGELLGHTIYFYSKDTGRPVRFVAPSFALKDITTIPRWRSFKANEFGCQLWWIEYGGRLDTVHDTEQIKWKLWKVVYGVWDHIKNSGQFPEAENLTLEWVGTIPGKRESRRFEGDYMLTQQDVVEQRRHDDAVSFGGWAIDLHPADGVFSEKPGCAQWHSKGVYQIPYRCMYSRNVRNLFLAGRTISASHVSYGSTRVMATCAHGAQAVGMAAALCARHRLLPRDLASGAHLHLLQRDLLKAGQHIPHVQVEDPADLARAATVTASSELQLAELPAGGQFVALDVARAMLLPLAAGPLPAFTFHARTTKSADVTVQLRASSREAGFTPDELLDQCELHISAGHEAQAVTARFRTVLAAPRYVMLCLPATPGVEVAVSEQRLTGLLSLSQGMNAKVSKSAAQKPTEDIGVDTFEFWLPQRRPGGQNLAMRFDPPLTGFGPANLVCGPERPTSGSNAWVADPADASPWVEFAWPEPRRLRRAVVCLDTDFDHPMESVLMGHPERVMPFCATAMLFYDGHGILVGSVVDNHQTRVAVDLEAAHTDRLRIEFTAPPHVPAAAFRVRIYG